MLDNLGKIGIIVCAGFFVLATISFALPFIDEMYTNAPI